MTTSHSTFIVGGTFRILDGNVFVQRRSWEMLRIFADQMAAPVFGMQRNQEDNTLEYPLPKEVKVVVLPNAKGKSKLVHTILGRALTAAVKEAIDGSSAVYLRQPLWECGDVFNYASSKNKKILVSYHGDWPDALRRSKSPGMKRLMNLAMAYYIHHVFKTMAAKSEIVFCVGEELHKKYGGLAKRSVVFANFLHTEDDIATPRALNNSAPYRILFVGHFEEYKGVEYLIEASALLKQKSMRFTLMLVGTGSREGALRELVKRKGLEDDVEWYGYIQHGQELMALYRQADLFVLPSIASEGTAKVLMESMSQGVPVVATDIGSTRHLLGNGDFGRVVAPANIEALFLTIRETLEDRNIRSALIGNGFALARESTRGKQEAIVSEVLQEVMPEILGKPGYLKQVKSR